MFLGVAQHSKNLPTITEIKVTLEIFIPKIHFLLGTYKTPLPSLPAPHLQLGYKPSDGPFVDKWSHGTNTPC